MFDSISTKYFRFARFAFFMAPEQSKDVFMAAVKERDVTEARDLNTVERLTTAQDVLPLTPQCTPREIDVLLSQRFGLIESSKCCGGQFLCKKHGRAERMHLRPVFYCGCALTKACSLS